MHGDSDTLVHSRVRDDVYSLTCSCLMLTSNLQLVPLERHRSQDLEHSHVRNALLRAVMLPRTLDRGHIAGMFRATRHRCDLANVAP